MPWPTVEELTTVLNLEGWENDDVRLTTTVPRALATAIDYVKLKRGRWVEGTDAPDEALSNAALRMAQLSFWHLVPSPTACPMIRRSDARCTDAGSGSGIA